MNLTHFFLSWSLFCLFTSDGPQRCIPVRMNLPGVISLQTGSTVYFGISAGAVGPELKCNALVLASEGFASGYKMIWSSEN